MFNLPAIDDERVLILEDSPEFARHLRNICIERLCFHIGNVEVVALLDDAKTRIRRNPSIDIVLYDLADERAPTNPQFGLDDLDAFLPVPLIIVTVHYTNVMDTHRRRCFWVIEKPNFENPRDMERFSDQLQLAVRSALALKRSQSRWYYSLLNWLSSWRLKGIHAFGLVFEPAHGGRVKSIFHIVGWLILAAAFIAFWYAFGFSH